MAKTDAFCTIMSVTNKLLIRYHFSLKPPHFSDHHQPPDVESFQQGSLWFPTTMFAVCAMWGTGRAVLAAGWALGGSQCPFCGRTGGSQTDKIHPFLAAQIWAYSWNDSASILDKTPQAPLLPSSQVQVPINFLCKTYR